MEEITWTDAFSVGVTRLDEQHKRLIGMINRLMGGSRARARSESVSELLADMADYASEHFATEEELLRRYRYPLLDSHLAAHDSFRENTTQFCLAMTLGVEAIPEHMLKYLRAWLLHHILEDDMAYRPFFLEHGVE